MITVALAGLFIRLRRLFESIHSVSRLNRLNSSYLIGLEFSASSFQIASISPPVPSFIEKPENYHWHVGGFCSFDWSIYCICFTRFKLNGVYDQPVALSLPSPPPPPASAVISMASFCVAANPPMENLKQELCWRHPCPHSPFIAPSDFNVYRGHFPLWFSDAPMLRRRLLRRHRLYRSSIGIQSMWFAFNTPIVNFGKRNFVEDTTVYIPLVLIDSIQLFLRVISLRFVGGARASTPSARIQRAFNTHKHGCNSPQNQPMENLKQELCWRHPCPHSSPTHPSNPSIHQDDSAPIHPESSANRLFSPAPGRWE